MKIYEGQLLGEGNSFGIVISRFNDFLTANLLDGCLDGLRWHGVRDEDIKVAWVPGAFEIPLVAQKMARLGDSRAVICLGAIIRGATPHFEYVAGEVAKGIAKVSLETGIPVVYGVLTADNLEQAIERAGTKAGNRGFQAAMDALEMANLLPAITGEPLSVAGK